MTEKQPALQGLGAYLRTLREGRGLAQEDIAYITGITSKQVSNWEGGYHAPGSDVLAHVIKFLNGDWSHAGRLLADQISDKREGEQLAKTTLKDRPGTIPSPRPKRR